jgi:hypothetical protein
MSWSARRSVGGCKGVPLMAAMCHPKRWSSLRHWDGRTVAASAVVVVVAAASVEGEEDEDEEEEPCFGGSALPTRTTAMGA